MTGEFISFGHTKTFDALGRQCSSRFICVIECDVSAHGQSSLPHWRPGDYIIQYMMLSSSIVGHQPAGAFICCSVPR